MIHDSIQIEEVDVDRILGVRTRVLRPHFAEGDLARWPLDREPSTRHFAALHDGETVGCVTFQLAPFPHRDEAPEIDIEVTGDFDVQLRGMAVDEGWRNEGVGAQLVEGALFRLPLLYPDSRIVWCNARQRALSFWERCGFTVSGDVFEKPDIGPHVVMWRRMPILLA